MQAQGLHSIRARRLLVAVLLLAPAAFGAASRDSIVLLTESQRREILPSLRGGAELVPLDLVLQGFEVATRTDPRAGTLTLSFKGREVVLYARKSLASVGGDLRLLSAPVQLEDGKWLVPPDSVPRVIGPLLGVPAEWRAAPRVLLLGAVRAPRVTVSTFVGGDSVRVVVEATEKVPFDVVQEPGRVTVAIRRELVDVAFQQERLTGGIVDLVQYLAGKDSALVVTLGRRFQQMKATELDKPARLVLEFQAAPLPARAAPAAPAQARPLPAEPQAARTLVIDPGHGGSEVGATGPGGTFEKDVTLAIARKLRAVVVNSQGLQTFLTRDRDQDLSLDERAAIANNYKANLFVSIHANASRAHSANGSEVYFLSYQATDDESRRIALVEGEAVEAAAGAPGSDVALILWDMAQAEHLEDSSALASRIQEELAQVTGSEGRGVKQAPFRVLVGATMAAVLVEVAFISNPEEEKRLASEAYQNRIAAALARGIARFERDQARRSAAGAAR